MKILENKKGNTLLIVLVAIFVLLSIGLYLNKIVLNQIKISNDLSKIKNATYAAESGIERTLFLTRRSGLSLNNVVNNNSYNTEVLTNSSSYKILSDSHYVPVVEADQIQNGDYYSVDLTNSINQIRSFTMSWDSDGLDLVFVGITRYNNQNNFNINEFFQIYNHYLNSPVTQNININSNGNSNENYYFEISPFLANIQDISITFYSGPNGTGNVVNIDTGNRLRIKSIGNIGDNNKSLYSDFLIDNNY